MPIATQVSSRAPRSRKPARNGATDRFSYETGGWGVTAPRVQRIRVLGVGARLHLARPVSVVIVNSIASVIELRTSAVDYVSDQVNDRDHFG